MNEEEAEAVAEAVVEEVIEEVALADGDDDESGRLVELREVVEDRNERLVDVDADPEEEVTEAVTNPRVVEVSSSSVVVEVISLS